MRAHALSLRLKARAQLGFELPPFAAAPELHPRQWRPSSRPGTPRCPPGTFPAPAVIVSSAFGLLGLAAAPEQVKQLDPPAPSVPASSTKAPANSNSGEEHTLLRTDATLCLALLLAFGAETAVAACYAPGFFAGCPQWSHGIIAFGILLAWVITKLRNNHRPLICFASNCSTCCRKIIFS